MKIKTIPNETVGLYTCFDENLPKATVEAEEIKPRLTTCFNGKAYCMSRLSADVESFVHTIGKFYNEQIDALLVVVDERGEYSVYDSLAQRGGKGLKKQVEVHRLKLFIALLKALHSALTCFRSSPRRSTKSRIRLICRLVPSPAKPPTSCCRRVSKSYTKRYKPFKCSSHGKDNVQRRR